MAKKAVNYALLSGVLIVLFLGHEKSRDLPQLAVNPSPLTQESITTPVLLPPTITLEPARSLSQSDIKAEKSIRNLFQSGDFGSMDQIIRQQLEDPLLSQDYLFWLRKQLPTMKLGWAWSMIRQRNCLDAIPLFEEVQRIQPHAYALKGLGFCLLQKKDFAQASSYLERYLQEMKHDPEAYILLAETKESLGETEEALEIAQHARTLQNLTDEETKDIKRREDSLNIKTEESYSQSELTAGFIHLRYQATIHQNLVAGSLDILQQTIENLNHQLGIAYPEEPIEVIFHRDENFQRITHSPSWSSGVYDGRVRIPVPENQAMDETFVRVLRHEITHAYRQSFYLLQVLRYEFGDILALRQIIEAISNADELSSDSLLRVIASDFGRLHQAAMQNWQKQRSF
ncbi:MAG: tetratricopeptide repeat protein [Proteobacteria bacterium]|nr:tetratricopeptide repeat protein [Pseudomonadota bacterium]